MDKVEVLREIKRLYFLCEEFGVLFFLSQQDDPGENYDSLLSLVAKNMPPTVQKDFLKFMSSGSQKERVACLLVETSALHMQYAELCLGVLEKPELLKYDEITEGICCLMTVLGRTALDILPEILESELRNIFLLFKHYSDCFSDMNLGMASGFFEKLGDLERAEVLEGIFEERKKFSVEPVSQVVYYNPNIDNTLPN